MASEILIPIGSNGLTLTANLYTLTSDTAVESGMTLTEKTNAKGWYVATNSGSETGLHRLQILSGSDTVGSLWVYLTNSSPTEDVADDTVALRPSTLGRTLGVESDGVAHADVKEWLGAAPLALSSQQVQAVVPDTQKVDLHTIKTQTVTCAGGVTIPAATLASTTNITAGTITTATNVTNVNDKTGYRLSSAGLDSVVVEAGMNARQALSVVASASAGKLEGADSTTVTIYAANDPATERIEATVDANGNRSAVTLSLPA